MGDVPFIDLDPYLLAIQLTLFALQEAGLIPDLNPLDYIIAAFGGKPKLEDTELAALRLQASPWWPLKALGTNLQIWVKNGVPLSTGIAAYRAQLSEWIRGTIDSLEPIVYQRLDPYSLDHAIWLSMTSQDGDSAIVQLNNTIAEQHALGPLPALPNAQPGGPQPPPPLPPGVVPGTGPNDILVTVDGDELNDLQRTVIFQNSLIYQALLNLGGALSNNGNDQCCTNVVQAISNVVGQLSIIAAAVSNSGSTTVNIDFTPLTTEIAALVTAIGAYPPALTACCAAVNSSLGGIRDAITNAGGTDTKPIVDALNKIIDQGDVDQAIFDALQQVGTLAPADLQVLQGIKWSDALSYIESVRGIRTIARLFKDVGADVDTVAGQVIGALGAATKWSEKVIVGALRTERNVIQDIIEPILKLVTSALQPTGAKQIGNIGVNPDTVLSDVVAAGINSYAITALIGLKFEGAAQQLERIIEIATGVLGFDELKEVQIGPLVTYGIARIAEMQAKKLFGQELPGAGSLAGLAAQGLITPAQYFTWVPYTGLPGELWEQTREAAFRGLNARQMLRLIETGLYSQAEITNELTFSGMRPASQERMQRAAPYLATNTERNALRSTLEKAYIAGLMDDPTLTDNVDSIEQNTDRANLVLQRVKWEVLIQETKDLEAEYTTLFSAGLMDDPTFRANLSGIGLQPWKVNTVAAKAEARANATLQRKTLAAAAALQKATATVERQTALKNYEEGNLPLPLYTAALIETGLTPTQAAAWTDLASLKKQGNVRWVYGLELPPAAATILKQRVSALTDQRKRQLITQPQYVQSLTDLGITNTWINALDAAAEAMLTPKIAAFPVPVGTA